MNRLVATEGRDKGGKLALITSRLNAEGGGCGKGERKEGKRNALVISTRPLPVMTGLFPFVRSPRRLPSAVCLRRHHDEDISISSSVILARFSTKGSDTLSELVSVIFDFLSRMMGERKKESSNEE